MKTPAPYNEDFNSKFEYNESSPTSIVWKKSGKKAGRFTYKVNGHRRSTVVEHRGKTKMANRLIWELFHGPIPSGMVIDHLDGNPFNNKITNLACKSFRANLQNRRCQENNSTGVNGVVWLCVSRKFTYACASYYNQKGEQIKKNFSVLKLGLLPAFYEACVWRKQRVDELNAQGENYTQRHIGI